MKRSGFRKQSLEEIKTKQAIKRVKVAVKKVTIRVKKKALPKRKTLTNKLWELCKQITREKYGNICYTCGAQGLVGSNWHTGHGKPKGALPLRYKYDLRNLRPQCRHCNMELGGCSDIFIARLEIENPDFLTEACEKTDGVWRIKQGNTMGGKDGTLFLIDLLEQYKFM